MDAHTATHNQAGSEDCPRSKMSPIATAPLLPRTKGDGVVQRGSVPPADVLHVVLPESPTQSTTQSDYPELGGAGGRGSVPPADVLHVVHVKDLLVLVAEPDVGHDNALADLAQRLGLLEERVVHAAADSGEELEGHDGQGIAPVAQSPRGVRESPTRRPQTSVTKVGRKGWNSSSFFSM